MQTSILFIPQKQRLCLWSRIYFSNILQLILSFISLSQLRFYNLYLDLQLPVLCFDPLILPFYLLNLLFHPLPVPLYRLHLLPRYRLCLNHLLNPHYLPNPLLCLHLMTLIDPLLSLSCLYPRRLSHLLHLSLVSLPQLSDHLLQLLLTFLLNILHVLLPRSQQLFGLLGESTLISLYILLQGLHAIGFDGGFLSLEGQGKVMV